MEKILEQELLCEAIQASLQNSIVQFYTLNAENKRITFVITFEKKFDALKFIPEKKYVISITETE